MHMRYIESFLALYGEGNISKASKKLFISQQGLSRQIQTLEKELGVKLFVRAKSGVVPTEVCISLHPYFLGAYENFIGAKKVINKHINDNQKPIVIAFSSGISHGLNTEVILQFQKENPNINFMIKEWAKEKCMEKLDNGDADIALLVNPFDLNRFNCSFLAEGYMYIAIHKDHPLAKYETIDFEMLDKQDIITGSEDNALRKLFDHFCHMLNIKPNIMFSSSYSLEIINSASENVAMATVTPIMAAKITNPNMVVKRLITPEPGKLYLCTSKSGKPSPEQLKVSHFIKDYFDKIKIIKI